MSARRFSCSLCGTIREPGAKCQPCKKRHAKEWRARRIDYIKMPLAEKLTASRISRFWGRVNISEKTHCWPWIGCRNTNGYGTVNIVGTSYLSPRVAWTISCGPIAPGLCVCHSCDNPECCNPSHLFLGTHKDNMADCAQKGRFSQRPHRFGEQNSASKISDSNIVVAYELKCAGMSARDIGSLFGLSSGYFSSAAFRERLKRANNGRPAECAA